MPRIKVSLSPRSYEAIVEPGSLSQLGNLLKEFVSSRLCMLCVDESVGRIYGRQVEEALADSGFTVAVEQQPSGEEHKTLASVERYYRAFLQAGVERGTPVVALGGGVAGDCAGFAAATFLRGLPLVQCPTTLLAMVDASLGGKTGVNLPEGKNLVGSIHQPLLVVSDPLVLNTLPDREFSCGLAECIKHGVIADPALFVWMEKNMPRILARDEEILTDLIARNVSIKAEIVAKDEREDGIRAHLNFGHTFAHAIEKTSGYTVPHGEAVSLGMIAACTLGAESGMCPPELPDQLRNILAQAKLPIKVGLPPGQSLLEAMSRDKKVRDGKLRLIIPRRLGEVELLDSFTPAQILSAFAALDN